MIFPWSQSDNQSTQISRTLLSILANLSIAVVWIVSILPTISNDWIWFVHIPFCSMVEFQFFARFLWIVFTQIVRPPRQWVS